MIPRDPAEEFYTLSPLRVDNILPRVSKIHIAKWLALSDQVSILVDAVNELLCYAFNDLFVRVIRSCCRLL